MGRNKVIVGGTFPVAGPDTIVKSEFDWTPVVSDKEICDIEVAFHNPVG